MGDKTVDRRRFIGLGLAAAGGAAVVGPGAWVGRSRLRWGSELGFPGRPNQLTLEAPDLPEGARVAISVEVIGPDPEAPMTTLPGADVILSDGVATLELAMTYPYERRVPGRYTYRAVATWRGAKVVTEKPATYDLIHWLPLS